MRLLWHRFVVDVDDPTGAAAAEVANLVPQVEGPGLPALVTTHLAVEPVEGGYRVLDGGDELARVATPVALGSVLHTRVHRRAFELASRRGWVRFHAVTADVGGRRVLAVGPSGSGKTTLALGLLAIGAEVQGDESVLVRDGEAIPVPRRLHVKAGSEQVVPEAGAWLATAPHLDAAPEVRALSPAVTGTPWRTTAAPVDEVVLLGRTDGPSTAAPATAADALPVLVHEAFRTVEGRGDVVRAASSLTARARVHHVAAGGDGVAPRLVAQLATA